MTTSLCLHEEIMLLALSDEKGTIEAGGTWYQQMVGGAVLAELAIAGRIELIEERKKHVLRVTNSNPIGNDFVDQWLAKMGEQPGTHKLADWLSKISHSSNLKQEIAQALVRRGILEEKNRTFLLIFNRTAYPESNAAPEQKIRQRLETALFTETREVSARTVALISILQNGTFLGRIFPDKPVASRQQRIDQLIAGDATGEATAKLIKSVQAAIMMACIVPIVIHT